MLAKQAVSFSAHPKEQLAVGQILQDHYRKHAVYVTYLWRDASKTTLGDIYAQRLCETAADSRYISLGAIVYSRSNWRAKDFDPVSTATPKTLQSTYEAVCMAITQMATHYSNNTLSGPYPHATVWRHLHDALKQLVRMQKALNN